MKLKHIAAFIAAATIAVPSFGQRTYSGYFIDGNPYRHDLNPAFGNKQNYIAFPVLGNINLGVHGNLNMTDIIM